MQVSERGLQELCEARNQGLPWGSLVALEVRGLLVLQLQLHQLQHQSLLPHCSLARWSADVKRPQVCYGEAKPEDGVRGEEGEGRGELKTLSLKGKKINKHLNTNY